MLTFVGGAFLERSGVLVAGGWYAHDESWFDESLKVYVELLIFSQILSLLVGINIRISDLCVHKGAEVFEELVFYNCKGLIVHLFNLIECFQINFIQYAFDTLLKLSLERLALIWRRSRLNRRHKRILTTPSSWHLDITVSSKSRTSLESFWHDSLIVDETILLTRWNAVPRHRVVRASHRDALFWCIYSTIITHLGGRVTSGGAVMREERSLWLQIEDI